MYLFKLESRIDRCSCLTYLITNKGTRDGWLGVGLQPNKLITHYNQLITVKLPIRLQQSVLGSILSITKYN